MDIFPTEIEIEFDSTIINASIFEIDKVLLKTNPDNLSGTYYRLFYTDSLLEDYYLQEFVQLKNGKFVELSRNKSLNEPFEQILKKADLLA